MQLEIEQDLDQVLRSTEPSAWAYDAGETARLYLASATSRLLVAARSSDVEDLWGSAWLAPVTTTIEDCVRETQALMDQGWLEKAALTSLAWLQRRPGVNTSPAEWRVHVQRVVNTLNP